MKLFPEKFPLIKSQEELESVQAQFSSFGTDYVTTACIKERRDWIELMWSHYEVYAETSFRTEFETKGKFNQKTWELYMASFLLGRKLPLLGINGEGPDFHIKIENKDIWIEATAPTVGEVDPAPERPNLRSGEIYVGGGDIETTYRPKVLRLTTAIRNKSKTESSQFRKGRLSGLIKENHCYVVAVNGYDFCGLIPDPSFLVRRTFFAAGCTSYPRNPDGSLGEGKYLYQPYVIKNKSDGTTEQIPTNIFTNDSYSEVSAIIYSPHHVINTGTDLSKISDTLTLIRNPFATNPLPVTFPPLGSEWVWNDGLIYEKKGV